MNALLLRKKNLEEAKEKLKKLGTSEELQKKVEELKQKVKMDKSKS